MKKHTYQLFLISVAAITIFFSSCKGEDRTQEYKDTKGVNDWIYSEMKDVYLWYNEIPASSKLNFFTQPDVFFYTLLSNNEKKNNHYYSWIERKVTKTRNIDENSSYGFEFMRYNLGNNIQYARVLYVLPNSPAANAGLKRGDWILAFNDQKITDANYSQLFTGNGVKLKLGVFTGSTITPFAESGTISLTAARAVNNDPILVSKVITGTSGNKIGYLMYTHFSTGPSDNVDDHTYENELRQLFASFKNQGVKDFVLDLRYNPGGYITNSQLLSTMLAPGSALDKVFCTIKYNDKMVPAETIYKFDRTIIQGGANLDLSRLYVLVSNFTASASELLINGLRPYMPVTLIGTTTEGKNLGSTTIEDDKYDWKLQPIIGKVFNSEDKSDYGSGFTPNLVLDEMDDIAAFKELGDENELMLKQALTLINGVSTKRASRAASVLPDLKVKESSLTRKATNGVWLPPFRK